MGKLWDRITKKEPEKQATHAEIEQLKMNLEREQLKSKIAMLKKSQPKGRLGKLFSSIVNETPERRKARLDNIKRGLDL